MANTYTQINIHAVFAVQGRENILKSEFRNEIFKYMYGILKNNKQFPLAINGYQDHVHLFFELHPTSALSDVVRIVKTNSSKWINERKFLPGKYAWQEGYGAFSYSRSQRNSVIQYIMKQEEHHKKRPFKEEYLELLIKNEIEYDQNYVFEFYDI